MGKALTTGQSMTGPSAPPPGTSNGGMTNVNRGDTQLNGQVMSRGNSFEGSKRDVEPKGMKEGSKREEAFDRGVSSKQTHPHAPHRDHKMRGGNY